MSQEVRDAVARLDGGRPYSPGWWVDGPTGKVVPHPIPDDLTACAKAWDDHAGSKGWRWEAEADGNWHARFAGTARKFFMQVPTVERSGHDAASELRDRWALLGLVLKARGVV